MEYRNEEKLIHFVGEYDPALQLSSFPVIQGLNSVLCEFQLRHLV